MLRGDIVENDKNFIQKLKELKSNIDLANKVLTLLDYDTTNVSLEHETPVYKKYAMNSMQNGVFYRTVIEFNGSIVKFTERGFSCVVDATGYMNWKLNVVRCALDKKIKQQEKAKERAHKKQVRAEKIAKKMQEMRNSLSDLVFGHDNTL